MKKNIGAVLALYPTPAVVVGTEIEGKVNWLLVAHVGIIGHDRIMLSMFKGHYTNQGVKATGKVSVAVVDEKMLERADYVGFVSGAKADKSEVFAYHKGEAGTPVIEASPLVMECQVVDNYETDTFDNFICTILNTYVEEDMVNEKGKPDYDKLKPVLFEMPNYTYLRTGETIGKCTSLGKQYRDRKYPKIALGTWSWGSGMAGGDQVFGNHLGTAELKPVFDEAMAKGLNLWDSAVVYGMGSSEMTLASFTKECRREDIFISTKFTPQIASDSADPVAEMCEVSLKHFGTDYIDMYWIHNPADVERWTPYLIPLVKSGKVRRVGVSNHNLAQIRRAEEILSKEGVHISAVQNHYSLLYRSSEKAGILDFCKQNGIDFWAYMVLEQGALSGKYDTAHPLPEGSQRGDTYNPMLPQIEKLVKVLREIGDRYGVSPAQIAMAWAIAKGTTPIIGVTKVSQVQDAVKAASITLTPEEISRMEEAAEQTGVDTRGSWEMPMI